VELCEAAMDGRSPEIKMKKTYRAAYMSHDGYETTVLTGPEHSDLSDEALVAEAISEARRADLICDEGMETAGDPRITVEQMKSSLFIGQWTSY
jgi:hypothetical protein